MCPDKVVLRGPWFKEGPLFSLTEAGGRWDHSGGMSAVGTRAGGQKRTRRPSGGINGDSRAESHAVCFGGFVKDSGAGGVFAAVAALLRAAQREVGDRGTAPDLTLLERRSAAAVLEERGGNATPAGSHLPHQATGTTPPPHTRYGRDSRGRKPGVCSKGHQRSAHRNLQLQTGRVGAGPGRAAVPPGFRNNGHPAATARIPAQRSGRLTPRDSGLVENGAGPSPSPSQRPG
ncbi:hypothetical protein SKAU_G00039960 [Synaphobranchus kaupii]|uniref:Uncharacterized protein n=1 Tax=Synaphobranchus kaupii TaxID=118154 RepID=A0A9Q1JF90_SYNKA|nr:hypothetical protein SKAU_G00039960 [Synaphobranchus kaupii]